MSITWKKITLEDEELFKSYFRAEQSQSCELTFANTFLWSPHYNIRYAIVENHIVFYIIGERHCVSFPIGQGDLKAAVKAIMEFFDEIKQPFCMQMVTKDQFERLESLDEKELGIDDMNQDGESISFHIEYDRDVADYIYESEKLISLSGKKLHSKRNHINKFKAEHDDWCYERITSENVDECFKMANQWCDNNGCTDDPEKTKEFCVTLNALKNIDRLGLIGGLIRLDGQVIAFSIGEPCNDDTFVVHIEKAFATTQGAYPIINQQFIEHEASQYKYINREEDTGAEGLRKAKLSYYPAYLHEKGVVTLK